MSKQRLHTITIDDLIALLQEQKREHGGDMQVVVGYPKNNITYSTGAIEIVDITEGMVSINKVSHDLTIYDPHNDSDARYIKDDDIPVLVLGY